MSEVTLFRLPQESILKCLLLNVLISPYMIDDIDTAKYPFASRETTLHVMTSLKNASEKLFQ